MKDTIELKWKVNGVDLTITMSDNLVIASAVYNGKEVRRTEWRREHGFVEHRLIDLIANEA